MKPSLVLGERPAGLQSSCIRRSLLNPWLFGQFSPRDTLRFAVTASGCIPDGLPAIPLYTAI